MYFDVGIEAVCAAFFRVDVPEVPFSVVTDVIAEAHGFINPGFLMAWHGFLEGIADGLVVVNAILMRPASREQCAPSRCAEGARCESICEYRAFG